MATKSFVENVNTIANATTLATGDIIEDSKEVATLSRRLGYGNKDSESSKLFIDDYVARSTKVREIYTRVLDAL